MELHVVEQVVTRSLSRFVQNQFPEDGLVELFDGYVLVLVIFDKLRKILPETAYHKKILHQQHRKIVFFGVKSPRYVPQLRQLPL